MFSKKFKLKIYKFSGYLSKIRPLKKRVGLVRLEYLTMSISLPHYDPNEMFANGKS